MPKRMQIEMQSMSEKDSECFANTGVNTPETMFPNSNSLSCPKRALVCLALCGSTLDVPLPKGSARHRSGAERFYCGYFDSLMIASAALPATTQLADPATTASSSNQRNPKSSMHSGKSGLIMMYPGITAPGMYELSARLLLYVFVFDTVPTPATYDVLDTGCVPRM